MLYVYGQLLVLNAIPCVSMCDNKDIPYTCMLIIYYMVCLITLTILLPYSYGTCIAIYYILYVILYTLILTLIMTCIHIYCYGLNVGHCSL